MPAAEVVVDADLVRTLLVQQHADLAALPLKGFSNGWDNALVRLGDELLVRLPRRGAAARLVAHEQRWLPVLAPRLTLPVPAPVRVGRPGGGYPWPWSITPYLPGQVAAVSDVLDTHRAALALGRFLARLHQPAATDAPSNPVRGIPLHGREASFAENLRLVGETVDVVTVGGLWREAVQAQPWTGPPVWLHGDLHPANILVDHGEIAGVIDFGDLTAGDPATDLGVAWMLLPRADREVFWDAYAHTARHHADTALRLRAKGWALALGMAFMAHSADNPVMAQVGRSAVDSVLADCDIHR